MLYTVLRSNARNTYLRTTESSKLGLQEFAIASIQRYCRVREMCSVAVSGAFTPYVIGFALQRTLSTLGGRCDACNGQGEGGDHNCTSFLLIFIGFIHTHTFSYHNPTSLLSTKGTIYWRVAQDVPHRLAKPDLERTKRDT